MKIYDSVFWRIRRTRHFFTFVLFALVFAAGISGGAPVARAGFGITPPYVQSDRLTRGSVYTQVINLVRSDPEDDLAVDITLNIPGAQPWFSVDRGTHFTIPKGVTQMPIVVTVKVPSDAAFNEYKGTIRIRTSAADVQAGAGGGVTIALGAQVDVDVKVVDKIFDFDVLQTRVANLEAGVVKWGLFFPGKISFFMTIHNTGNTTFGPTKVHVDIYDVNGETLVEAVNNTNKIEQIPAFSTKELLAELPTRLPVGVYQAKYTIYKNADIAQQGELTLNILTPGSVPGYNGYGFDGLNLTDKLKVFVVLGTPALIFILFITALVARARRRRRKKMNGSSR